MFATVIVFVPPVIPAPAALSVLVVVSLYLVGDDIVVVVVVIADIVNV